jgi:hypothetical protein
MLKDMSWRGALENMGPVVLIGVVVLTIASVVFMKKHRIKVF